MAQRGLGSPADPPGSGADGDASGTVDGGDLDVWQSNFGEPAVASAAAAANLQEAASLPKANDVAMAETALGDDHVAYFVEGLSGLWEAHVNQTAAGFVSQRVRGAGVERTSNRQVGIEPDRIEFRGAHDEVHHSAAPLRLKGLPRRGDAIVEVAESNAGHHPSALESELEAF